MREYMFPSIPNRVSENGGNVTNDSFLETKYKSFLSFRLKNSVVGLVGNCYQNCVDIADILNFLWKMIVFGSPKELFD